MAHRLKVELRSAGTLWSWKGDSNSDHHRIRRLVRDRLALRGPKWQEVVDDAWNEQDVEQKADKPPKEASFQSDWLTGIHVSNGDI